MDRVRGVVVAPIDELADAAPRDVPQVMEVRTATSPAHRVEEHALPQRRLRVDE